jgi:hypothetical protein
VDVSFDFASDKFELRLRMNGSFAGVPRRVAVMLTRLIYGLLLGD